MIFYLSNIQEKLGYKFNNTELLRECFTHPSFTNENKEFKDYERLEFLGDSILGYIVAEYLYKEKAENEGLMTSDKQAIVSTKPLSEAFTHLGLSDYVLRANDTKITDKICENIFEALIAGLYLDGGIEVAKNFVKTNLIDLLKGKKTPTVVDYKSKINELASQKKLGKIEYKVVNKTGSDHLPEFVMAIYINGELVADGKGKSKKIAEQECAKNAIQKLKNKNNGKGKNAKFYKN